MAADTPTSSSEQSRIMDSLRLSFMSRRNSSEGSNVGGGSDSNNSAGVASDNGTGGEVGTGTRETAAAAGEEDTATESEAKRAAGEGGGGDDVALLVDSKAATRSSPLGVIGDGRRGLRSRSSSSSMSVPTEETRTHWEDEQPAQSCAFQ